MSKAVSKPKRTFLKKALKRYGNRYDYDQVVYRKPKTRVTIICRQHGPFMVTPKEHLNGLACGKCKESKGETRVRLFLEKHGIDHVQEHRILPFHYRYDFYVPSLKVLIEYHGQQHYMPVVIFGGEEGFKQTKKRDKAKRELAESSGLTLIALSYRGSLSNNLERILKARLACLGHVFKPLR